MDELLFDPTDRRIAELVFENRSFASLKLLGRALASLQTTEDGLIAWAVVTADDFTDLGASDAEVPVGQLDAARRSPLRPPLVERRPGDAQRGAHLRHRQPFLLQSNPPMQPSHDAGL